MHRHRKSKSFFIAPSRAIGRLTQSFIEKERDRKLEKDRQKENKKERKKLRQCD